MTNHPIESSASLVALGRSRGTHELAPRHTISAVTMRAKAWRRAFDSLIGPLAVSTMLLLSSIACTSGQLDERLIDTLENDAVLEELRYDVYDATADQGPASLDPNLIIVLDVEEFVADFLESEEGWPAWLATGDSTNDSAILSSIDDTDATLDWLYQYIPGEARQTDGIYVWSLYWTLAMPPAPVQLEILEKEFVDASPSERNIAEFRSRYPEYLAELAHTWLDVNSEHQPDWLRIE